jgi:hypothetical protein
MLRSQQVCNNKYVLIQMNMKSNLVLPTNLFFLTNSYVQPPRLIR